MRVFCDTSVLVAASLANHPDHLRADAMLDRICQDQDTGYASAHVLAETFSVLTRMPTKPKLSPADVLDILENDIIPHFVFVALQPNEYSKAIRDLVTMSYGGGRIYDLLHLRVASKLALDRIYTLNENEWRMLAPELDQIICVPPPLTTMPPGN